MLARDAFGTWLGGEAPIVDPNHDATVKVMPVSPKMNSPKYNKPDYIEALVDQNRLGIAACNRKPP